jgi:hypothetical protein
MLLSLEPAAAVVGAVTCQGRLCYPAHAQQTVLLGLLQVLLQLLHVLPQQFAVPAAHLLCCCLPRQLSHQHHAVLWVSPCCPAAGIAWALVYCAAAFLSAACELSGLQLCRLELCQLQQLMAGGVTALAGAAACCHHHRASASWRVCVMACCCLVSCCLLVGQQVHRELPPEVLHCLLQDAAVLRQSSQRQSLVSLQSLTPCKAY